MGSLAFRVVARQLPEPEGTAAGRTLLATCEGLLAEGHDVDVWSWSPTPPSADLPGWCSWQPLPAEPAWRTRGRALLRPRSDVVAARRAMPPDAIAVADDVPSFAAVAASARSVATLHLATALDAAALGRRALRDVQDRRAEHHAARSAGLVLAYSPRVGSIARGRARFLPVAHRIPAAPIDPVAEPVAALVADWSWPPNLVALRELLEAWPPVRDAVPGARLLLAGRSLDRAGVGAVAGVEALGAVTRSVDVLAAAAVVAFPCPPTSGPKIKVLEALAHGVAVLTTPAGVEGLVLGPVATGIVATPAAFGDRLVTLLSDPQLRAGVGAAGRDAVVAAHSPVVAARARVAACRAAFPEPAHPGPGAG